MKHLAILLCLTLCFGLFACTNNTDDGKVPEDENANGGEEITENGTNDDENAENEDAYLADYLARTDALYATDADENVKEDLRI